MRKLLATVAVAMLATVSSAQAHYLWIEPANNTLVIRFGEVQEKVRETEAGYLKSVKGPTATLMTDGVFKPVAVQRLNDGFAFPASGSGATMAELGFGLYDQSKENKGVTKLEYYARFAEADTRPQPVQPLDIVPIADGKVRITLNGKAVADHKVTFVSIDLKEVPLTTDKNGDVTLPALVPGLHIVDAIVRDEKPGTHDGKRYDRVSYRGTLALLKK